MKIKEGKFDRIPSHFSEELQNVVDRMLQIDHSKRPSVLELIKMPRVSLKIKEIKLKEKSQYLEQREKELNKREEAVEKQESEISERLSAIEAREKKVAELEAKYKVFVSIFTRKPFLV